LIFPNCHSLYCIFSKVQFLRIFPSLNYFYENILIWYSLIEPWYSKSLWISLSFRLLSGKSWKSFSIKILSLVFGSISLNLSLILKLLLIGFNRGNVLLIWSKKIKTFLKSISPLVLVFELVDCSSLQPLILTILPKIITSL
jgi:hypothetical protein